MTIDLVVATSRIGSRRARLLLAAGFVAVGTLALPLGAANSFASPSCGSPGHIMAEAGGWTRVAAPQFAAGEQRITSYAVDAASPALLYASNGLVVDRSSDGGCTWATVFTTPQAASATYPFSAQTARIVQLVAESSHVYAVFVDTTHPHVLVSTDAGRTWTVADAGLMPSDTGSDSPKLVADQTGDSLALLVHGSSTLGRLASADVIYSWQPSGQAWLPRPVAPASVGAGAPAVNDIAMDPLVASELWAATAAGLEHSTDGGSSWSAAGVGGTDELGLVTVLHRANRAAAVFAADKSRQISYLSTDSSNWSTLNSPAVATSASFDADVTDLAISSSSGVFRLDTATQQWTRIHDNRPTLSGLSADRTPATSLYGCACAGGSAPANSIWIASPTQQTQTSGDHGTRGSSTGAGGGDPRGTNCPPRATDVAGHPRAWPASTITPDTQHLGLGPGQSVVVPYNLALQPRELDVYFLDDNGPRGMQYLCTFESAALRAALRVVQVRNLQVGLGEFRDYPSTVDPFDFAVEDCSSRVNTDFVYHRDLSIGSPNGAFRSALAAMTLAGNCTDDHAALEALLQAATGVGQPLAPRASLPYGIPAGQQAGFNTHALKVMFTVAGSWFETPKRTTGYLGVDFPPAIDALRSHDIQQLGICVQGTNAKMHPETAQYNSCADTVSVARASGALSPTSVDCTGSGYAKIHPGDPLVCAYNSSFGQVNDPTFMAGQVSRLLEALRDPEPVRYVVLDGGDFVSKLTPPATPKLEYLLPHTLGFSATYTCGAAALGTTQLVRIGAVVRGEVVATTSTLVSCGQPATPPRIPRAAFAVPPPPTQSVPGSQPNPGPGANPAPNPAPNQAQAPQAQSQPIAQGVTAPQRQAQLRTATVQAQSERNSNLADEQAMSVPKSDPLGSHLPLRTGAVAVMACLTTLVCVRSQARRTATASSRSRQRANRQGRNR